MKTAVRRLLLGLGILTVACSSATPLPNKPAHILVGEPCSSSFDRQKEELEALLSEFEDPERADHMPSTNNILALEITYQGTSGRMLNNATAYQISDNYLVTAAHVFSKNGEFVAYTNGTASNQASSFQVEHTRLNPYEDVALVKIRNSTFGKVNADVSYRTAKGDRIELWSTDAISSHRLLEAGYSNLTLASETFRQGTSGSAVFNENNELIGVIKAMAGTANYDGSVHWKSYIAAGAGHFESLVKKELEEFGGIPRC